MMQASIANERVSECDWVTGLCITNVVMSCMPSICKMMQASIANERVSECDWVTGLCITNVVTKKHIKAI